MDSASIPRWLRLARDVIFRKTPWQTGFVSFGLGDLTAQMYIEDTKLDKVDWVRTFRFATVGLFVGPRVQRFTTHSVLMKFGKARCPNTPVNIAVDKILLAPFANAGIVAYSRIISGDDWPQARKKAEECCIPITVNSFMVWPAMQMINHFIVPAKYSEFVATLVSVFWNAYLSNVIVGKGKAEIFDPRKYFESGDKKPKKKK
ncbi:mpv17-like protein [Adelges cooleyi]|uniref:mpv17-like protein n=1 Tax=Adelges cooleyi TaxID=133065 RepID=UPI00217F7F4F|nr:mpv17-like protein [Adelges cooleyi]